MIEKIITKIRSKRNSKNFIWRNFFILKDLGMFDGRAIKTYSFLLRRRLFGGGRFLKKCAVFTICKNENIFLPIWLKHYSNYFDICDIYVLDHESTDGSTDNLPCNKIVVSCPSFFDHAWLLKTVQDYQKKLFKKYEWVLFTEADELVFPDPGKYATFEAFIRSYNRIHHGCSGYEVVHQINSEPDIDLTKPLLRQRSKWFKYCLENKPLLSSVPLVWSVGFHGSTSKVDETGDLFLIHLHRLDFKIALERNMQRKNFSWFKEDVKKNLSLQNRIYETEKLVKYFEKDVGAIGPLEDIPERFKNVI